MKTGKDNIDVLYIGRFNFCEQLSGPEKTAKRIFEQHSKNNKTAFIQYFFDGNRYSFFKKLFGFEANTFNSAEVYTAGLFRIYKILKQNKPKVIHIITFERFAVIVFLYKMFNDVKVIYNSHGVVAYENTELKDTGWLLRFKDKFCEKTFLQKSDRIIFNSENPINIAQKFFSFDELKCIILPNGIDDIFYNDNVKQFTAKLNAVFIFHNSLYLSGLEFLKNCYQELASKINLFIITKHKTQITDSVEIAPMQTEELMEFYKDKHVFLALNRYDTFSISAAEAMASGLIPIVTKETGISRYIENGHNGFIIPYGDSERLKTVFIKLNGLNADEKKQLSQNAKAIYHSLKWENVYEMYKAVYSELLK